MHIDDDVAASLPTPPYPAPARKAAAIARAMGRFDGESDAAPASANTSRPARWGPYRLSSRPYAGALVSLALVAMIGIPVAWNSMREQQLIDDGRTVADDTVAPVTRSDSPVVVADSRSAGPGPGAAAAPVAASPPPPTEAEAAADLPAPAAVAFAEARPALQSPRMERAVEANALADKAAAEGDAADDRHIVITGVRSSLQAVREIKRNSETAVDSITASDIGAAPRGDWNACTVDDPGRNISACRPALGASAARAADAASAHVPDGLALAWQGDLDDAIAAFDRAIAAAPRSADAYLNRGMAYRSKGDLDRAIADFNRAVRYAPRAARGYYNRSLVLRQMGAVDRARADEQRAIKLDPRYRAILR
jgi:hypothetical protein